RAERVLAHVQALAGQVLGLGSAAAIAADRPLRELGLDSLLAIELRNLLGRSLGQPLPATLLFDYPTLRGLRDYLLQQLPGAEATGGLLAVPAGSPRTTDDAVAIIGVGCRLPGRVRDLEGLWQLLAAGADAIGEVPRERWQVAAYYHEAAGTPGKMNTR